MKHSFKTYQSTTRRQLIAGIAGILATSSAPAYITKSLLSGKNTISFDSEPTPIPSAADYIQDDLVLFWDGIENEDFGVHNSSALVWKDLSLNGFDLTVDPTCGEWGDNCIIPFSGTGCPATFTNAQAKFNSLNVYPEHIELVCTQYFGGNPTIIVNLTYCGGMYQGIACCYGYIGKNSHKILIPSSYANVVSTFSCSSECLYVNGVDFGTDWWPYINISSWGKSGQDIGIAGCPPTNPGTARGYAYYNPIYSIRAYNRVLTPEEIAYNASLDKIRFKLH